MDGKKVVVVGAGPVGSLAALYAASRGADVEVYELRNDLRNAETTPLNFTKSINLALSERGINALRSTSNDKLLETVLEHTIPMHGRMIHTRSATGALTEQSQLYDVHGRFQRSVDRGVLNGVLLDHLDSLSNVKIFFQHKLTGADFRKKKAWFEVTDKTNNIDADRPKEIEVDFDLLIGADGAHSATRYHMMKYARMDYHQEYIDCLWCEFTMPPNMSGDFAISPHHLHIWPAGSFMFIALPNLDKSFVCTLFGPVDMFVKLENAPDAELVAFFDQHFPGVTDHISPDDLIAQFKRNPHLPLINIKCSPHHFGDSVVIVGDAANAMVPFYGQGMNAGMESVRVLFSKLDEFPNAAEALTKYTEERSKDAHVIADLALGNYIEMRSSVTSRLYKLRKYIEERLDKYFPSLGWATQYSRVSFSNMRYSEVLKRSQRQKRILTGLLLAVAAAALSGSLAAIWLYVVRFSRRRRAMLYLVIQQVKW
ncbi:kynurenine 3-monooxygenase, mitochondrial precursor [Exophiala dermatitidis]|uniref:Kynurenine 3-monooxygenase n=2 Tax=Exophiala dermatitidis TaxID=5970 RepID=H6BLU9_EXODN|nr:kynurenine 3-monooxygenase [Exophiala dermatitidis NIH/UT8656]KAJ4514611.1 kynurenine 3-monooxygenase, mitochondrial precursor [Exophiala dermatitidis]EHY51938.1 kynurenine 3-monooxygenase [Exophiala dermatitidis NIH/UT8656]KAJ4518043.1 kynurenine 3-monooxygenase, mitochondrial precursor [Exophiala dermatitidis]KAJ4520942.1 kynurenine 3-monooxygenase, mitochondrial precursor [Exophiala dermatitidis]KAJ4546039.1 kynurenine 3-monooxygenase, mitochondrial precursor [Exophiala dermatitidis]